MKMSLHFKLGHYFLKQNQNYFAHLTLKHPVFSKYRNADYKVNRMSTVLGEHTAIEIKVKTMEINFNISCRKQSIPLVWKLI